MQQAKTKKKYLCPRDGQDAWFRQGLIILAGQEKLFYHHPGGWPYASDAG